MGSKFRRIDPIEQSRHPRVFANLQKILNRVRVEMVPKVVKVLDIGIGGEGGVQITAAQFMSADMIDSFLIRPVFVDLPGKKLVEGLTCQAGACQQIIAARSWFRKYFRQVRGWDRGGRFIAPIESPVSNRAFFRVRIGLLVALQMVPPNKNDAAGVVD